MPRIFLSIIVAVSALIATAEEDARRECAPVPPGNRYPQQNVTFGPEASLGIYSTDCQVNLSKI